MKRTETKIDPRLLEDLRVLAAEQGREKYEVVDAAARFYLEHLHAPRVSLSETLDRARERRERSGIPELSEDEAMKLAVEEQHAWRRGQR